MTELSIVIPTFDRAATLRECLDSLARQTAPPDAFDVVVVDDGSSDETPAVLDSYDAPFPLHVLRQPNQGQTVARNRALEQVEAPFCLFIDDDILADPDLVAEHLRAQREEPCVGVGALRLRTPGNPGGLVRHFERWWDDHYRRLAAGAIEPDFRICYSGNFSAPTDAIRRAGAFDTSLPASFGVELAFRLERAGLRVAFLASASGEQVYTKDFRALVRDFDAAGAAAPALMRKHPELARYAPLGDFTQGGPRTVLLRRLLLAVRAPTWPLRLADPLLARRPPARVYRFLQLHCFWRGVRAKADRDTWLRLTRAPVVLMYHAVGGRGERASRYVLPERRLRRQLDWLRRRRYPVLSLDELVQAREENRLPEPRSVVLTFDDGYADTGTRAAPLLRERGFPATVFVVTGAVDGPGGWETAPELEPRALLGWPELLALRESGLSLGAHTVTHRRLPELEPAELERELVESRDELARRTGERVRHFAYPYGKRAPEVLEAAGRHFASACGIDPGTNGPAVPSNDLRRLEVHGTRSLPRFALEVWLGFPLFERRRRR